MPGVLGAAGEVNKALGQQDIQIGKRAGRCRCVLLFACHLNAGILVLGAAPMQEGGAAAAGSGASEKTLQAVGSAHVAANC